MNTHFSRSRRGSARTHVGRLLIYRPFYISKWLGPGITGPETKEGLLTSSSSFDMSTNLPGGQLGLPWQLRTTTGRLATGVTVQWLCSGRWISAGSAL